MKTPETHLLYGRMMPSAERIVIFMLIPFNFTCFGRELCKKMLLVFYRNVYVFG